MAQELQVPDQNPKHLRFVKVPILDPTKNHITTSENLKIHPTTPNKLQSTHHNHTTISKLSKSNPNKTTKTKPEELSQPDLQA
jgi:hypothetical protein